MVDYVKLKETADRLISKNGRDITMVKFDTEVGDVNAPWKGPTDPRLNTTEETIKAVMVEPDSTVSLGELANIIDLTTRSDKIFIAQALTQDLTKFNEINDSGIVWKVDKVGTLRPGSVVLLYFIEVSR